MTNKLHVKWRRRRDALAEPPAPTEGWRLKHSEPVEDGQCNMCGKLHIKYLHLMEHADYAGVMVAGSECAEHMVENPAELRRIAVDMRAAAKAQRLAKQAKDAQDTQYAAIRAAFEERERLRDERLQRMARDIGHTLGLTDAAIEERAAQWITRRKT